MTRDIIASAVFYPAVVLALHYWYVRKRRHPDWVPWRATGRFIWELLWPCLLVLVVVVTIIIASGVETSAKALGPIMALLVAIPAFRRARRLITEPPQKWRNILY